MSKICFFFQIKWSEAGKDGGMEERVIDMAFDGITIACIRKELEEALAGGRIYKIAQPEADELLLTVKNNGSEFLHASPQASSERQDSQHHTARNGTGSQF